MSGYNFRIALNEDDAQLRERMALDVMHGKFSLTFRREPSYFQANSLLGTRSDVIVCEDVSDKCILALGARHQLPLYINGTCQNIGYLSDLRSDPNIRNGLLLARGYRFLKKLHQADPLPFYISMIFLDNDLAKTNLEGGRAGLPNYKAREYIDNSAIMLNLRKKNIVVPGVSIEIASDDDLPEIVDFYNSVAKEKQFAPHYSIEDFNNGRFAGLQMNDIFVARKSGRIKGVLAAWDQSGSRQTYLEDYSRTIGLVRPAYNLLSKGLPFKKLPAKGQRIPYLYLVMAAIQDNDKDIYRALLRTIYNARRTGPWHYLIPSFAESDPCRDLLDEYTTMQAGGTLYIVSYEDGASNDIDTNRITYVEIARI